MKAFALILLVLSLVTVPGRTQEFINLDFESSTASDPMPGWRPSYGNGFLSEGMLQHLGMTPWFLVSRGYLGTRVAAFTAGLASNSISAPHLETFISQTGRIPADAETIRVTARGGAFRITAGDLEIPMVQLGADLWVGDVSQIAGEVVELKVINATGQIQRAVNVDEISFGRSVISSVALQNNDGSILRWSVAMPHVEHTAILAAGDAGQNWKLVAEGDFNGDGANDLVFQNQTGLLRMHLMQGEEIAETVILRNGRAVPQGWRAFAAADINDDGSPEILFQHSEGQLAAWLMEGTNFITSQFLNNSRPVQDFRALAVADLNGDSHPDILFQNSSRALLVSLGTGSLAASEFQSFTPLKNGNPMGAGWRVGSVLPQLLDDGSSGILFQHSDGRAAIWRLQALQHLATTLIE